MSQDSRKGTAYHEVFHSAWDLALNAKEKAAMRHYFEPKAEHRNKTATELMADGYKAWKEARKRRQGTIFGKLYQKIYDFLNAAHVFFTGVENVHNIYRKIENGDVWKRDAQGRFASADEAETNYKVNPDVDANRMVNVVSLTGKLPNNVLNNQDLKTFLRNLSHSNVAMSSADKKAILDVLPKHVNHVTYSSKKPKGKWNFDVRTSSVFSIQDLVNEAVLIESIPNRKSGNKPNVAVYHRLYVPVEFKGRLYAVRIVAEERQHEITFNPTLLNLYDVVVEKENRLTHLRTPNGSQLRAVGGFPLQISIYDMLKNVKDYDGVPYYSVRPERVSKVDDIQAGMKQPQDNKGKKPHITVEEKVRTDSQKFGMLDTVLHSPSYVAEKYARFRGFFRLGAKAMDKQEYLRNKFDRHLKRMLDPLQTREEKGLWNTILYYR